MIQQRPLGRTGLRVSVLGLGTVKFGRNTHVRYPDPFELPDDAAAARLLDHAFDCGINLIDTAPAYGESEARLGRLLKGRRDDWILCTKAGEEYSRGRSRFDFSATHMRRSVERSLARLDTDYLDCVLVHSDGRSVAEIQQAGALEALAALRDEGKLLAFGVSTKSLEDSLAAVAVCDLVMLTLSATEPDPLPALDAARLRGCGVLVKKALSSGHLPQAQTATQLHRAASRPGVSAVIVGTLSPAHLAANACALADIAA